MNKLFSEENKVPRTRFEARKVAGPATYKQSQKLWMVSLFENEGVYA